MTDKYELMLFPELFDGRYPVFPKCETFMKEIWKKFKPDIFIQNSSEIFTFHYDGPVIYNLKFNDDTSEDCYLGILGYTMSNGDITAGKFGFRIIISNKDRSMFYNVMLGDMYFGKGLLEEIMNGEHNWDDDEDYEEMDDED